MSGVGVESGDGRGDGISLGMLASALGGDGSGLSSSPFDGGLASRLGPGTTGWDGLLVHSAARPRRQRNSSRARDTKMPIIDRRIARTVRVFLITKRVPKTWDSLAKP